MVPSSTISPSGTIAWITEGLAFLSSEATARSKITYFISGTFIVAATASFNTSYQWVALQTRRTNTDGSVKVNFTLCPAATLSSQARIYTLL